MKASSFLFLAAPFSERLVFAALGRLALLVRRGGFLVYHAAPLPALLIPALLLVAIFLRHRLPI